VTKAYAPRGEGRPSGAAMLAGVLAEARHIHPEDLGTLLRRWGASAGVEDSLVYIADRDQIQLTALDDPTAAAEPVEGTLAGRCYQRCEPIGIDHDGDGHAWFPLTDGTSRVGVMRARLDPSDPTAMARGVELASLAAYLLVVKAPLSDQVTRLLNARPLTLAAEMRWAALPPLSFEESRVAIGAMLQPAYEIAGDTIDYAVDGDILSMAIFDAMGHGLTASQLASTAVYAYRLGRRQQLSLEALYRSIDDAVADQFGDESYVTAQLATLDLSTGSLRSICAGHPQPLLLRERTSIHELPADTHLPLGLGHRDVAVTEQQLQPGDTIVYYSDGISEARAADGEEFGVERLKDFLVRAAASDLTPAETARRALHAVRAHHNDHLADDATLALINWHGQPADDMPLDGDS
jgi:serine/threonine protein phosphatase PrpC